MPYRDMARDAGCDPDTDEGRQMAEYAEEMHRQQIEHDDEMEAEEERRLYEEMAMEGET